MISQAIAIGVCAGLALALLFQAVAEYARRG
jgi:hypothetical protein